MLFIWRVYLVKGINKKPRTNKIKKIERKGKATERLTYKIA